MDEIILLLGGILAAAFIFAATLFSGAQSYMQAGPLRWAHLAAALATIAAMAALSAKLWPLAQALGAPLALSGLLATVWERRWNRILPLFHIGFGAILLARIPFGG